MSSWFSGGGGEGALQGPTQGGQTLDVVSAAPLQGPTQGGATLDSGGGVDWNKVLKGIGTLSDAGQGQGQQGVANLPGQSPGSQQAPLGAPRAGVSFADLLNMMAQRQAMYQQAALHPAPGGPPQAQPRSTGLLGI